MAAFFSSELQKLAKEGPTVIGTGAESGWYRASNMLLRTYEVWRQAPADVLNYIGKAITHIAGMESDTFVADGQAILSTLKKDHSKRKEELADLDNKAALLREVLANPSRFL